MARKLLFIGSYPVTDAHQAMHEMMAAAKKDGTTLIALPDGETGAERLRWQGLAKDVLLQVGLPSAAWRSHTRKRPFGSGANG